MRVMGLDTSTRTGCVVLEADGKVAFQDVFTAPKVTGIRRAVRIGDRMAPRLEEFKPDLVVFEGYGFGNAHTLATLVEVGTVLRMIAFLAGYPLLIVPPSKLKVFVTGKGNSKKDAMAVELFKHYGYEAGDDNLRDAFALSALGHASLGAPVVNLPKTHMRALDSLGAPEES